MTLRSLTSRAASRRAAALVLLSAAPACNSALGLGDLQIGVRCGEGTELVDGTCQPAVVDPDAPSFGGVTAVSPASPSSLRVDWDAAASSTATPDQIVYSVYLATKKGGEDFHAPALKVKGTTTATVDGLTAGTDTWVVVRAEDEQGHQDANKVELHQKAQGDTKPPSFAGVGSAAPVAGGQVKLSWSPASDDLSGAAAITYRVFAAPADPDPTAAPTLSVTGVTSATVVVPVPGAPYRFLVRAVDAAGNEDANTVVKVSTPGADSEPPDFAGCATAVGTASNQITVTWAPGHDGATLDDALFYDVYAFDTPGPHADVSTAVAHGEVQGKTTLVIGGLLADTAYSLECFARDLSDNVGGAHVDVQATTLKDVTPPTFAGALGAAPVTPDSYQITVTWAPATDIQSAAAKIAYDVFTSSTAGGEDYSAAPAASVTGKTQVTMLVRPGETTYLVVLARDEAGNVSTNVHELSVTPHISYDCQVQPIFDQSCVSGCHDLNQKFYNPILARPVSYTFIANDGVITPGNPDTSWLYQDLVCQWSPCPPATSCFECGNTYGANVPISMPEGNPTDHPPPSAAAIDLIRNWLLQGAPGPLSPDPGTPPGYSATPNCHP